MILAYFIHGPWRDVVDGLRLMIFVLSFVLVGQMVRYAKALWDHTEAVRYDETSGITDYMHRWSDHNKRLLGRIWLCVSWVFFLIYTLGTTIRYWDNDMGYWRLPCIILALASSSIALHYLTRWNNLRKD